MKVLVINSGSSSIKFELFDMPGEEVAASGSLQRIGESGSELTYRIGDFRNVLRQEVSDHAQGLQIIAQALTDEENGGLGDVNEIGAVGHRVVHGGEAFAETVLITPEVIQAVEDHVELAPLHNPPNLLGIQVARELLPNALQVAVFDTAFHQSIPETAFLYAIPFELYGEVRARRYGFHGTSHRYVARKASTMLDIPHDQANLITCHLGNGCSITAVEKGRSVDTSMGLTPLEGLIMGTRSGDVDPALVSYLERVKGWSVAEIDRILNKKSGLLGVSGLSNDVRTLLEAETKGNARATLALEMYCYRIRKYVGAYTAVLGRVDALVFTAGVGENSPEVRERVVSGMEPLGYRLHDQENRKTVGRAADIAHRDSRIRILAVPTDEELLIARDTYRLAANTT